MISNEAFEQARSVGTSSQKLLREGSEPLANEVTRRLRQAILEGKLKPGERIRQEAVAREYGTSRIPVRQALQQLQNEGLVVLKTHVGARVAELDAAELDEIYQMRERLEPLALARSVPSLTEMQLEALSDYLRDMEAVGESEGPARWIDIDRRFHLASYAAAGMPKLQDMIEGFWNTTQQYRRAYTLLPERIALANAEHRLLLEAIERGDPEDAERLSLMHIRRTRLTLAEHTEIFDEAGEQASRR